MDEEKKPLPTVKVRLLPKINVSRTTATVSINGDKFDFASNAVTEAPQHVLDHLNAPYIVLSDEEARTLQQQVNEENEGHLSAIVGAASAIAQGAVKT